MVMRTPVPEQDQPRPDTPSPPEDKPAYLRIFTPRLLMTIAVLSFGVALLLSLLAIFDPPLFDDDTARYMLCLAVATNLAVFFFIFFPEKIQANLPMAGAASVRLVGPIVLWCFVFTFLLHSIPLPERGRVFEIWRDGKRGGMVLEDSSTTYLTVENGKAPRQLLIGDNDGTRNLFGIYVEFPKNVRRIDAKLHHLGWAEPISVVLERGPGARDYIDVTSAKERTLE